MGIKYFRPGRTSLTELICDETRLILSRIVSPSQNIILLCLPMNSVIRCLRHTSPISFKCSISISRILSRPGCVMPIIRPFPRCFLKSMQKLGAVIGLGLLSSVRYISGRLALAEITSLYWPFCVFIVRRSSSASGCAILYNLPPMSFSFSSCFILEMTIPSSAIKSSLFFRRKNPNPVVRRGFVLLVFPKEKSKCASLMHYAQW